MLIKIRDKASSLVAYIIIGLLVISFALWGIQEYFGAGTVSVADVDGSEISLPEFNSQLQRYKQKLRSDLGDHYALLYPDENVVKREVLDAMLEVELLRREVNDAGFQVSDARLSNIIQRVPQFQRDGQFDPNLYERLLQVQRYSTTQFETELREEDKLKQFEVSLMASSFMPKKDLQHFQRLSEQSRDIEYALIKVDPEAVAVSAQEIDDYYRENERLYRTPEQVKLVYIELREEELQDRIHVAVEDARSIFESQPERYMTTELRRARHILLKVPGGVAADAIEWDEALDKANELVEKLKEGASFTELAAQYSEDSLSAEKGGEIGFIGVGDFTSAELEEALFSLNVGEHSGPVRAGQGVRILRLDEIQAAKQKPFEEVKEQIINESKSQLAQQRFVEIAEELANLVVEQPDDLQEASESFGLDIKETGWLAPDDNAGIFAYPKVRTLAFSDDILSERLNSDLVEVADGHVIAFRLLEHKPSEQKSLADVSGEIGKVIAMRKAAEQSATRGWAILAQMQAGASLKNVAMENSLELVSHSALHRDDKRVPYMIAKRAFKLPRPAADQFTSDGMALPDGSFALVELQKVTDGAEQRDVEEISQLSPEVNYGRREFNAIVKAIKGDADVQVFENNL